jgi:hypothetical protein
MNALSFAPRHKSGIGSLDSAQDENLNNHRVGLVMCDLKIPMIRKHQVNHDLSVAPVRCDLTVQMLEKLQVDHDQNLPLV